MASLAELYAPVVAVTQFVLAGAILWLGRGSTRAYLAATILLANGIQTLALLAYTTEEALDRPAFDTLVERLTAVEAYGWLVGTELLIALSVGLVGVSLVHPLRRAATLVPLYGLGLVLPLILFGIDPATRISATHTVNILLPWIFALSLTLVCTWALPRVLAQPPSSGRIHGLLIIAAVLVPMTQQHIGYLTGYLKSPPQGAAPLYAYVEEMVIGFVAAAIIGWACIRLLQAARREGGGPPLWVFGGVLFAIAFRTATAFDLGEIVLGEHIPSATLVFAQLIRPALLFFAFARFESVRLSRAALRPLSISVSALFGFAIFVVVLFIAEPDPYGTSRLGIGATALALALASIAAGIVVPWLVRAADELALEVEAGGRGARLERYKAAMMAGDHGLRQLQDELGISDREHAALERVLTGNLVIPEVAARGLRPGDRLEGYTVTSPLGGGGQGVVVRAEDDAGREVVIKQVRDAWAHGAAERVRALKREARAGAQGGLREVIETPFAAYLVRDFVPGRPMDEARGIDAERVHADLSRQLAQMHASGWVHGDVKPGNVIIRPDGGAVLIDEGAAVAVDDDQTRVMASPGWAAPEQLLGEVSQASDVFQLGRLLEPHARSERLKAWVGQALATDPAKRPRLG